MRIVLNAALLTVLVGMGSAALAIPEAQAAGELQAGSIAIVTGTGGEGLRVRSGPGVTNRILGKVADGQRLEILDGPVSGGGLEWYQVKSGSLRGWSNAKYLTPADRAVKSMSVSTELTASTGQEPSGSRTFVSKTTGYATGNPGVGTRTATGTTVKWGTVSVDPKVIPFGSQLLIDGFDGTVFTAEDQGSAVRGTHVDIFFPEPAAAGKYGSQQRRVTVIREGYGR